MRAQATPIIAILSAAAALAGCGGDDGDRPTGDSDAPALLPDGGEAPPRGTRDLAEAARAGGCRLTSWRSDSRDHTDSIDLRVSYRTEPPTAGTHFQVPADDGAYLEPVADTAVVHSLEHGRVVTWFDPALTRRQRATLLAVFEEDSRQQLLVPRPSLAVELAASAWNKDPEPNGTGRLLRCPRFSNASLDALRAFRDEHRGRGPEPIP